MSEDNKNNFKDDFDNVVKKGKDIAGDGFEKAKEAAGNVKEKIAKTLDVDNDGKVNISDFKLMANKAVKKGEGLFKSITKKKKDN